MLIQDILQLGRRLPAEAAIRAQAEFRQIFARDRDPLLEPRHIVNRAKINASTLRAKVAQRRKELVIAAIEDRNMYPVDLSPGCLNERIGKFYGLAEIVRLEPRPSTKCAEAKMIAKRNVSRNVRRQVAHFGEISLDGAFKRKAGKDRKSVV